MPFDSAKEKFERIKDLVRRRATGPPEQLAERLGISRATWFLWLEQLRRLGLPIAYDEVAHTYYYTRPGRANFIHWEEKMPADSAGGGETDQKDFFAENWPV